MAPRPTPDPTPDGLGVPPSGAPVFTAPPAAPGTPPPPPWAPPDHATPVAPPPKGRPPLRSRPGRRVVVAAALAVALLGVGILGTVPLLPRTPTPTPSGSAPPAVVTATPTVAPVPDRVLSEGGDLGRPVSFNGATGSGTIVVTRATWTDAGDLPPAPGRRYLVLDVTLACTGGELPVDPLLLLAVAGTEAEVPGFGPQLDRPLTGRLLASGERVEGQVGYQLPSGAAQVRVLDENLQQVATVAVPAP